MPAEQPEYDLRLMPFTTKFCSLIRKVRPGLELAALYTICARISSAIIGGRAVMLVAPMGTGKGDILKMTMGLFPKQLIPFYSNVLSRSKVKKWLRKYGHQDKHIECSIEDMSASADDYRKFSRTFYTMAALVSDKAVAEPDNELDKDDPESKDDKSHEARVKSFSVVACTTNRLDVKMEDYDAYDTMWRDRIDRLYPILSKEAWVLRETKFTNNPSRENYKIKIEEVRKMIMRLVPKEEIPEKQFKIYDSSGYLDYHLFPEIREELYGHQHTDDRAADYFGGDLTALAFLNGRNYITQTDIAFYNMYACNLILSKATSICQRAAQMTLKYDGDLDKTERKLFMRRGEILSGIESHSHVKGFDKRDNPVYFSEHGGVKKVYLIPKILQQVERQEDFVQRCIEYEKEKTQCQ